MVFQKVQKFIDSTDIVSFDVFDTLITRKVLHPADVFSLAAILAKQRMNISFDLRKVRIEAEKKLVDSEKKYSYNIQDIYKIIKKEQNLSDELTEQLLTVELEAEEKLVCPRKDVRDLFMELYNSGKKLLLVSDMYLSSSQVKHLLEICGYPDNLDLFVSNEHGKSKSDGSLWKEIVGRFDGKRIFHIGDDKFSDSIAVKRAGQKAFLIKKSVDSFFESKLFPLLQKYDNGKFENSLILGKLSNEILFNNAFSGAYNYDELTGLWTGAALACFIRWLINTKDDSLLLFVTRECYIFQPMYLEYCKIAGVEPQKNTIFYTSRQAASIASVTSIDDLKDLLEIEYEGTLKSFFETRCGFETEGNIYSDIFIKLPKDKETVLKYASEVIDEIVSVCTPRKRIYKDYIAECLEKSGCSEATIVDIGYRGTTQYLLIKIWGKPIKGKYFIADSILYPEKKYGDVKYLSSIKHGLHPIYDNIPFFEAVLQVPYGQLLELGQSDSGKFIMRFNAARQTAPEIIKAQSCFLRFIKFDAEWYNYLNGHFDYPMDMAEDLWMGLAYYNFVPLSLFNSFSLDDEFRGFYQWKYNPKKHCMENESFSMPFVFYKSRSNEIVKQKIKNVVKSYTPSFLFEPLRHFWIRFIK